MAGPVGTDDGTGVADWILADMEDCLSGAGGIGAVVVGTEDFLTETETVLSGIFDSLSGMEALLCCPSLETALLRIA